MNVLKSIFVWITGIFFITICFPVTCFIWLLVLPFDRERKVMHWMLIYQSYLISMMIPIWKTKIEGREKADRRATYVIISNHQSILDIIIINCLRYRFIWISKIENMKRPVLGWYLTMARYITVDRGNKESKEDMIEKSYRCLMGNTSVMMFPEGTRSVDGEIGFFKRGAFQLAIRANKPILPLVIDGTGKILPKHGLIFNAGHRIKIKVLDPVPPESFKTDDCDALALKISALVNRALKELREEKN